MTIFTTRRARALSTFHGSKTKWPPTPLENARIGLWLEKLLNSSKPVVINGKSYGLVEGHPETQGVYSAYMSGYYNGMTSPRAKYI